LVSDVANGTYNFIDPSENTPAIRSALAPDLIKVSTTDEDSWDMRASHDLFALPGGEAQLGLSLEARHEATFDPDLNPSLDAQGLGIAHTIGNRNIYSASAEVGLPILPTLEADVSGRFDHYSDFGDTFNPKVGMKWTPIPQVAFRGTYSTGFRAPSFSENGSSESEGFVAVNAQSFASAAFLAAHGNDNYVTAPYGFGLISLPNQDIKPETARNYTAGTILTPFSDIDLNGTVDYYNITKSNVIEPPSPAAGLPGAFYNGVLPAGYTVQYDSPDPLHPSAAPRPIAIAADYINGDRETTSGLDINIHFGTDLGSGVRWSSEFEYTQIFDFKFTPTAGGPTYNYVGTQSPFELSSSGGTPRDKGNWANTITWDNLSVTGTLYYTDGFKEYLVDATGERQCGGFYPVTTGKFCTMDKFYDFDLTARYHLTDTVDLFGGISNLFDQKAPLDVNNYGAGSTGVGLNYDPTYAQAGAVGRFFNIGVSFKQ
jgi:iron complex outermembrane receptor protein